MLHASQLEFCMHYVSQSPSPLSGLGAASTATPALRFVDDYPALTQKLVNSAISLRSRMCEQGWKLSRDGGQSVAAVNLDDPSVPFKLAIFFYKFQILAGQPATAEADERTMDVLKALSDLAVGQQRGNGFQQGAGGLARFVYQKFDWQTYNDVLPGQPTAIRNGQVVGCSARRYHSVGQAARDKAARMQREVTGPTFDWLKGTTFAAALGPVPIGDLYVGNRPTTTAGKSVPLKLFDIYRATLANYANVISDVWYTAPGTAPSSVGLAIQAAQAQGDYGFAPSRSHGIYGLLDKRAIKWFLAHKDIATDLKTWVDSKLRITSTRVTDALRSRDRRFDDLYQRRYTASSIPWADEAERRAFYAMARDGSKARGARLVKEGKLRAEAKRQRDQAIEQRRAALEAIRISEQQRAEAKKAAQQIALLNYAAGRLASKVTGGGGFAVNFSLLPTSGNTGASTGPSTSSLLATGGFNASNINLASSGGGGSPGGGGSQGGGATPDGGGAAIPPEPVPEVIESAEDLPPEDTGGGPLPPSAVICPEGHILVAGQCVPSEQPAEGTPYDDALSPEVPAPEPVPPVEQPKKGKGGVLLAMAAGAAVLYSLMG